MFVRSIIKGQLPKTDEELKEEQKQKEIERRVNYKPSELLLKTVQKNVQPIFNALREKEMNVQNKESVFDADFEKNIKEQALQQTIKLQTNEKVNVRKDNIFSNFKQEKIKEIDKMTTQEIDKKLDEIENTALKEENYNYLNLFGVNRGRCMMPECLKQCVQYRGSYNIKSYQGVELFSCLNCKCPMNLHEIPEQEFSFSNQLSQELSGKYIESKQLNFKSLVGIFVVWPEQEDMQLDKYRKYPIPEYQIKKRQQQEIIYNVNLEKMVQILNEGCFDVMSYYDCTPEQLKDMLIEKKIYSIKKPVAKNEMEEFLSFIKVFRNEEKKMEKNQMTNSIINMLNNERDLQKLQLYLKYKEKIEKKFNKISELHQKDIFDSKVYILLISSKYTNPYTQFRRFLVAAQKSLPQELIYYYSSKYKYKGIIDCQQLFPDFFKMTYQTFILTQHIPRRILMQADQDKSINEDVRRKKKKMLKEREIQINDGKLRDYLDFNNFQIVEEQFDCTSQQLYKAFDFIDEDNSKRDSFFQFSQVGTDELNIKICAKIGPPTYTTISNNIPNVYRITDPFDNDNIATYLCDQLNYSQRIAIIIRPIVVKSKLDELILNIFRINDFIIVNRVFVILSQKQVNILANLENISLVNRQSYINMMTEGFVSIVLLTKPGGIKAVEMLSNGCHTGLKLQKTNFLEELYVEHEQAGVTFKEKIQKQFYNVFQSYTNLNMFSGIKDFFNIEKLILQDDDFDDEINNIFIDKKTNQVYYDPQSNKEVNLGKRYNPQKRISIIEDVNNERYNFFIFSPIDEITTEQIVSIFMPEQASIQLIHLILKPQYTPHIDQVERMLQKMKFKVWCKCQKIFNNTVDARLFIESIQVLKIQSDQNSKASYNQTSAIYSSYTTTPFYIISCVKPAGRKEMLSFLQDFKLTYDKNIQIEPINILTLKSMLIPCHTDNSHFLAQSFINNKLKSFSGNEIIDMETEDQKMVMKFMLECTFATSIHPQNPIIQQIDMENALNSQEFVHYRVNSDELGEFEIRIYDFSSASLMYDSSFSTVYHMFYLQSWYYSLINSKYMQRCPLTYQFRLMPDYKNFEEKNKNIQRPTQVFDVQEYIGGFFIQEVAKQMMQYRKYEITEQQKETLRRNKITQYRGSIAAYLWGMRLAKFVKEIENLSFPNGISGFGKIEHIEGLYQGQIRENESLLEQEMQKYYEILTRIQNELKLEDMDQSQTAQIFKTIQNKLDTISRSQIYKYSRQQNMRRIMPSFVENENLRVRVDNKQIFKRVIHQNFETQDELFEKTNANVSISEDIKELEEFLIQLEKFQAQVDHYEESDEERKSKQQDEFSTYSFELNRRKKFMDEEQYMLLLIQTIEQKKNLIIKNFDLNHLNQMKQDFDDYDNSPNKNNKQEEQQAMQKTIASFLYSKNLQEKANKLKNMNISKINTFAFAYTIPEIKSKYSLAANILYLIQVHFQYIQNYKKLVNDDEIEYKHLLDALNHGFNTHYRMDIEDLQFMREQYQDKKMEMREKLFQIPDLIKLEQFLLYLNQLDRYLSLINDQKKLIEKFLFEFQKELQALQEQVTLRGKNDNELNRIKHKWTPKIQEITNKKKVLEQNIKNLISILVDFKTDFNYEESMQSEYPNEVSEKQRIHKNTYFQRFDNGLEYFESDPDLDQFQVDIMEIAYKFDPKEDRPNLKLNKKNYKQPLLEKYGDSEILKGYEEDPLQKAWFNQPPLFISHMRPQRIEDRDYILVEKKTNDKVGTANAAIDKEIREFKKKQKEEWNDWQEDQKQVNLFEKDKQQEEELNKQKSQNPNVYFKDLIDNIWDNLDINDNRNIHQQNRYRRKQ